MAGDTTQQNKGYTIGMRMLLLLAYISLGIGIFINNGLYDPRALAFLTIGFCALLGAGYQAAHLQPRDGPDKTQHAYVAGLMFFMLLGLNKPAGLYIQQDWYHTCFTVWSYIALATTAGAYLVLRHSQGIRRGAFILLIAGAYILRIMMLTASPQPDIDVFTAQQRSSQRLLERTNPYAQPIMDANSRGHDLPGYFYTPANLYPQALAYYLLGDTRWANIAAEIAIMTALWYLARPHAKNSGATIINELLILLFAYHPRGLFIIEQSWAEPLIVASYGLSLCLYQRRSHPALAAGIYGYMLALKQYLIFFALHWLIIERRMRYIAQGLAVTLLTFIPFLASNPSSLINNGVLLALKYEFHPLTLTLPSWASRYYDIVPSTWWSLAVGLLFALGTLWYFRHVEHIHAFLFSTTITTFAFFLFGKQAFANYYYVIYSLILLLIAHNLSHALRIVKNHALNNHPRIQ